MPNAPVRRQMIRLIHFIHTPGAATQNCSRSTAFKWIREGKLELFKVGRMSFVCETFDQFIERQAELNRDLPRPVVGRPKVAARQVEDAAPEARAAAAPEAD